VGRKNPPVSPPKRKERGPLYSKPELQNIPGKRGSHTDGTLTGKALENRFLAEERRR